MTSAAHSFDDAVGYEQFMGRWSRPLGQKFLGWLSAPKNMRWLDVGCGTGIFTQAILETCSPEKVVGLDCAEAQIEHARHSEIGQSAEFRVADAQRLPFGDACFDVVASLLAINFVPDRSRALAEMRRVVAPSGIIAACVWDFAAGLSPSWPIRRGMSRMGIEACPVPGTEHSGLEALVALFRRSSFAQVAHTSIEVEATFANFEEFWRAQTPSYAPTTKAIIEMSGAGLLKLKEAVRAELPVRADGHIVYRAQANAIRGRTPASFDRWGAGARPDHPISRPAMPFSSGTLKPQRHRDCGLGRAIDPALSLSSLQKYIRHAFWRVEHRHVAGIRELQGPP